MRDEPTEFDLSPRRRGGKKGEGGGNKNGTGLLGHAVKVGGGRGEG